MCCPLQLKNVMVIGIDTYHDSLKKGRSVMGFIASTNASLTRSVAGPVFRIVWIDPHSVFSLLPPEGTTASVPSRGWGRNWLTT